MRLEGGGQRRRSGGNEKYNYKLIRDGNSKKRRWTTPIKTNTLHSKYTWLWARPGQEGTWKGKPPQSSLPVLPVVRVYQ